MFEPLLFRNFRCPNKQALERYKEEALRREQKDIYPKPPNREIFGGCGYTKGKQDFGV